MAERFDLFVDYCLASIINQTNKDFIYLIYFEKDLFPEYLAKMAELSSKYSFIHVEFVCGEEEFFARIGADLLKYVDTDTKYIISSRIDNDDALHKDAIAKIQHTFKPRSYDYAINLARGYRFVIEPEKIILKNNFFNGPFISFVEKIKPKGEMKTVYCHKHEVFFLQERMVQVKDKYYWVQTIHNANLANDLFGVPSMKLNRLRDFGFDYQGQVLSWMLYWQCFRLYFFNVRNYIPFVVKIEILKFIQKIKKKTAHLRRIDTT